MESITIKCPYDGSVAGQVEFGGVPRMRDAISLALSSAPAMAALSSGDRSALLLRVRDLLAAKQEDIAQLISMETAKPIRESRGESARGLDTLLESAIAARELRGEAIPIDVADAGRGRHAMTVREPLGVIGAITPWNFPLNLVLHKVGPAIAAGNALVLKPSESSPLTALRLAALFQEAGLPEGAFEVVPGGPDVGQALVEDERVSMITFTGSVEAGKWIRTHAGLKRVTLELGGNCPVIVHSDGDVDLAASRCVQGGYANNGQSCISVQRIFVHESVADQFTDKLVTGVKALRIGHPLEETSDLSALITEDEAERVETWIREATEAGAKLLTGGKRTGASLSPAVLADLPGEVKMACFEVFGPVVSVNRYEDLDDAIRQANSTAYGLQAGIFTRDLSRAFTAARSLRCGGVLINDVPTFRVDGMPYGGAKESGIGREGPRYAVEEMTEPKLLCWR